MAKTITEVATDVLRKLGRLPDGQVAVANQIAQIEYSYDGLYEELANDSLVNWASTADIPNFAVHPITMLLLGRVADNFGVPNQWIGFYNDAREILSKQLSEPYVHQPTQFENF